MNKNKDLIPWLKKVYFLENLNDKELLQIAKFCKLEVHPSGKILFREGDEADKFYILVEGNLEIVKSLNNQEYQILAKGGPGDFFGEVALIDGLPRSATIILTEESTTLCILKADFDTIVNTQPEVAKAIMHSISTIVRRSNDMHINDLKKQNQILTTTNDSLLQTQGALLKAERMSTVGRFSSTILHDIRNPLTVISGYAQLITQSPGIDPKVAIAAEKIILEAEKIKNFSDGILDFIRGDLRLELHPIALSDFVDNFYHKIESSFFIRNITLKQDIPKEIILFADPIRMERLFFNLASNSKKAMKEGGTLEITASMKNENIVIVVRDTGCGMTPEMITKAFESWSHAGGTGLGMSIVKSIVDAHNANISISSKSGSGTAITMEFPLHS